MNYNVDYPIRHGIVDNWDNMEKYWQRCIYQVSRSHTNSIEAKRKPRRIPHEASNALADLGVLLLSVAACMCVCVLLVHVC